MIQHFRLARACLGRAIAIPNSKGKPRILRRPGALTSCNPLAILGLTASLIYLSGCSTYTEQPLSVAKERESLSARQATITQMIPEGTSTVSFHQMATIASEHNLTLKALRKSYRDAAALAGLAEPWPNPSLTAGVNRASGLENPVTSTTQPFVSLGFTLPLWGKRGLAKELRTLESQRLMLDAVSSHRSFYLSLRAAYVQLVLQERMAKQYRALHQHLTAQRTWLSVLQDGGHRTSMEANAWEMELADVMLEIQDMDAQVEDAQATLATLLGGSISLLDGLTFSGAVIDEPASLEKGKLKARLLEHRPSLAKFLIDYQITEKALQAEIRAQYPDITIGGGYEKEPGEDTRLSALEVGVDIPLFDRNQVGIAKAFAARNQARHAYQRELNTGINELDLLYRKYDRSRRQLSFYENRTLPLLRKQQALAKQTFQRGELTVDQYFAYSRQYAEQTRRYIALTEAVYRALFDMEACIGLPLFTLPSEIWPKHFAGNSLFTHSTHSSKD